MKVKCVDYNICGQYGDFTFGKDYIVLEETDSMYAVIDDVKDINHVSKDSFKPVKINE